MLQSAVRPMSRSLTLVWLAAMSGLAHAGERTVRVDVTGPGVTSDAPATGALPWTASYSADGPKSSVRLDLRADEVDGKVVLSGDIVEVKGSKEKPARHFELALVEPGIPMSERTEWMAPKGYVSPEGKTVAMLQWRMSASWDQTVEAPPWDAKAPADWPAGSFVVVRTGGSLYRDATTQTPQTTAGFSSEARGEVWELVGEEGDRLQLRAPRTMAGVHPMPLPAVAGTGVTLWAPKGDVVPVTVGVVDLVADDGTALRLRAGVPIEEDGGVRQVGVGPLLVNLGSKAVKTGTTYGPSSAPPERDGSPRTIRASQGKPFGDTAEGDVAVRILGTPEYSAPGRAQEVKISAVQVGGRFAVRGPSGEAVVRVRPELQRLDGATPAVASVPAGPMVPSGTALSWMDGAPAGTTADPVLRSKSTRTAEDGRTCGRLGGEGGMTLCWQ